MAQREAFHYGESIGRVFALWLNGPIGELYGAVIDLDRKAATSTNEGKR